MAWVGQALAQAGPWPTATRSEHERAFVGLVVDLGDARDVEGTALHAIAAADAVLVHEVDDAVGVLHDGAGRRAGLEAARILAMHAAVLADQPLEIAGLRVLPLGEAHQRQGVRRQVVRVVVDADVDADLLAQVVPLQAGDLAGLAADALRDVDELGHLGELTRRRRHAGGRAAVQVGRAELQRGRLDGRVRKRRIHGAPPLRDRFGERRDIDQERLVFRRLDIGVTDDRASACWRRSPSSSRR